MTSHHEGMDGLPERTDDDTLYAFRRNLVVAASAGTGKTFRLVSLYVLLNLGLTSKGQADETMAAPPVTPRAIVATTFSRAAALEIRHRVIRLLRMVATGREDASVGAYLGILDGRARMLGLSGHQDPLLRQRAQEALAEIPLATIDTLHGVAAQIVRANAMELGLSPAFAIAEEEEATTQAATVFDQALVRALTREDPAGRELLLLGGGLGQLRTHVLPLLDRAAEEGVRVRDLDVFDPSQALSSFLTDLERITAALIDEGSKVFGEGARAVLSALPSWRAGTVPEKEIARALELLFGPTAPRRRLPSEETFYQFRGGVGSGTNAERAHQLAAFVAAAPTLHSKAIAIRRLLDDAAEDLLAARIRSGRLAFGDLLRLSRDVLRDHPDAGLRTRERCEVLLVDEFQDTSRIQRDLVYLLRERTDRASIRTRGTMPTANDLDPSGLLVVGDRKQSIYAFRGADVSVFAQVCAELAGERVSTLLGERRGQTAAAGAGFLALSENRRSTPSVLSFVNEFSALDFKAPRGLPFEIRYADAERLRAPQGAPDGPAVTLVTDDGTTPPGSEALVQSSTGSLREALVAAALIESVVRTGAAKQRRYSDFAVLARRRATLPLLEFALARLEVPYCVAGRNLFGTQEVRDLLAVLRLLLDPADGHALATVLRGPALGLTDTTLTALAEPGRGLSAAPDWPSNPAPLLDRLEWLPATLRNHGAAGPEERDGVQASERDGPRQSEHDRARLSKFAAKVERLQRVALGLGPADALRSAIEQLDLDYLWSGLPRAAQRLGNVARLIALAAERGGSLSSFVRWLQKKVDKQQGEQEASVVSDLDDAVTLLTIHASKGLEFKSVVVVDLGASCGTDTSPMALWPGSGARAARLFLRHRKRDGAHLYTPDAAEYRADMSARETAERQRLTYVAFTRAREELYLIGTSKAREGSAMATLTTLLGDSEAKRRSGVEAVSAAEVLEQAMHLGGPAVLQTAAGSGAEADIEPAGTELPLARMLSFTTTELTMFAQCPRRYRLLCELGLREPAWAPGSAQATGANRPSSERRPLGSAEQTVLEQWPLARWGQPTDPGEVAVALARAGFLGSEAAGRKSAAGLARWLASPFAADLRDNASCLRRAEPFVAAFDGRGGPVSVRGTIDLLIARDDGSADVVAYHGADDWLVEDYEIALRIHALVAQRSFEIGEVRVAVAPIGPAFTTPASLPGIDAADWRSTEVLVRDLADKFATARSSDTFEGRERAKCDRLRCGFVVQCHGCGSHGCAGDSHGCGSHGAVLGVGSDREL